MINAKRGDKSESMPRLARLDTPGVLHHLMIRGTERRKIFWSDDDREDFLDRLSTLLPETQTLCYAWTFLPNHAHFLFRRQDGARTSDYYFQPCHLSENTQLNHESDEMMYVPLPVHGHS